MTSGQRVLLNTIATYTRTVFSIALGLFSGRWILQALGEVDYGLMGVVGSLIGFVSILNGIVSGTCARFFALSIGRNDIIETNKWFNTALSIHTVMPTILVLFGWPIGEWFITYYCNIPSDRLATAQWVYSFSMISTYVTMISAPFMGMLIAKQRIFEVSLWQIAQTLCSFIFVYWLLSYKGNSWLIYSLGSVIISSFFTIAQSYRSKKLYKECCINIAFFKEKSRYKQIFSFAGWQLFGGLTGIFRGNLIAILINKNFNPIMYPAANASMQIGNTVSSQTSSISTALRSALTPEITSTEGKGDRQRMLTLANHASKFSCLLILLIAIPLCLEIKEVLKLWLVNPPEYAWYFSLFYIACLFANNFTSGYMIAINAVGKIKWYQITVGGLLLAAYPLAWILIVLLKFDYYSVSWALLGTTVFASALRIYWANKLCGASVKEWIIKVFKPLMIVLGLSGSTGLIVKLLIDSSILISMIIVVLVTVIATISTSYIFALTKSDRAFMAKTVISFRKKIFRH